MSKVKVTTMKLTTEYPTDYSHALSWIAKVNDHHIVIVVISGNVYINPIEIALVSAMRIFMPFLRSFALHLSTRTVIDFLSRLWWQIGPYCADRFEFDFVYGMV